MAESTVFDKIISREIPADVLFEDEQCLAFRDINPQAPIHFLVIPKRQIVRLADATDEDGGLLGHLLLVARRVAADQGLDNGFRAVINSGDDGGQTVDHIHVHVLGGRALAWPPG